MFRPRGERGIALAVLLCALAVSGCAGTGAGSGTGANTTPGSMVGMEAIGVELADSAAAPQPAARIEFVVPGLPADDAGVREGDILVSFAGRPVHSDADFTAALREQPAGAKVPFTVLRQGKRLDLAVFAAPRPVDYDRPGGLLDRAYAARIQAERQAAVIEEQAGHPREALAHDVLATRLLLTERRFFQTPVADPMAEAVRHMAALLPKLQPPPALPHEAVRRAKAALDAVQQASDMRGFDRAAADFARAVYEAPWIADLYRDAGLTFAGAGDTEEAILDLRLYRTLAPSAPDAEIVKRKLDELSPLAEERKPWLKFARIWNAPKGGTEQLRLRGRHLLLSAVTPNPHWHQKSGDPVCWGEIHGRQFTGECNIWYEQDDAIQCFGEKRDHAAHGWLTTDDSLIIDTLTNFTYYSESCTTDSGKEGHYRWVHVGPPQ